MRAEKRTRIIVLILAVLFTAMQLTGWQISMRYGTSVHRNAFFQNIGMLSGAQLVLGAVFEMAFWYAVIDFSFYFLGKRKKGRRTGKKRSDITGISERRLWLLTGIGLFLCLLAGLLACFPGIYTYDAQGQLGQAMYPEVAYTMHHPLLHTLFMGKIITFGYRISGENLAAGIFLHSIVQMLICTAIFTYAVRFVWNITGKRWLAITAFLYYAFFPTVVMFTFCTTKDVLCSAFLHLMAILVYEMYQDMDSFLAQKGKTAFLILSGVLMCLFRNNGIYAIVLMALFTGLFFRQNLKAIWLIFIPVAFLSVLSNKGLQAALQARSASMLEASSVPIQQLARVYHEEGEGGFTGEELELLYQAVPAEKLQGYTPTISDSVKNFVRFDDVVMGQKGEYFKLWLKKGIRYPGEYIASFLDNTYQAWYPGTSVVRYPGEAESDYLEIEGFDTVEKDSKIEWLYDIYYRIATEFSYQKFPGVRLLFSIGAMFWAVLFTWFYGIWRKDKGIMAALLLILCFCITCFLGPTVLVRYYLNLFYIFPVCLAFLFKH